jgi:biotin carboxyl carrier protein
MAEHLIRSPLPGVFYRRPGPDQPVFVEEGATVEPDHTIGVVEIMKQFTEVRAGAAGVLASFAVESEAELGPGDVIAVVQTS